MPATTLTDRAVIRLSGEDVRGFVKGWSPATSPARFPSGLGC